MKKTFQLFLSALMLLTLCFRVNVNAEETSFWTYTFKVSNSGSYNPTSGTLEEYTVGDEIWFFLTGADGYTYPDSLTITADGMSFTDFEYDSNTGRLRITIPEITSSSKTHDIVITGDCKQISSTKEIVSDIMTGTFIGESEYNVSQSYAFKIVPNDGHDIPDSIRVYTNETPSEQMDASCYTYDSTTGEGTLNFSNFDLTNVVKIYIQAYCWSNTTTLPITKAITNGVLNGESTITSRHDYSFQITPTDGYNYPNSIELYWLRDGEMYEVIPFSYVGSYDSTTGKGTINLSMQGGLDGEMYSIKISGVCLKSDTPEGSYAVTKEASHCTITGEDYATSDEDYTFKIVPDTNYRFWGINGMPSVITINGELISGLSETYNESTGEYDVTIPKDKITGDIMLHIYCVKDYSNIVSVTNSVTNGRFNGENEAVKNNDYTFTIVPNEYFDIPTQLVNITVGETTLTQDDYTYDWKTGVGTIPADIVTGDIQITAVCTGVYYDTPTLNLVNAAAYRPSSTVQHGIPYELTLVADDGYVLPYEISVLIGESKCTNYSYDSDTGYLLIPGDVITGNITISVTALETMGGFNDVTNETYHSASILFLAETGISTGWPNTDGTKSFRPLETVKRCDMAAFLKRLARVLGDSSVDSYMPSNWTRFIDVAEGAGIHEEDVLWLAENNISTGWADGTFRPLNEVARADMAAFLRRIAKKYNIGDAATWKPSESDWNTFKDVTKGSGIHEEDILWLAHAGISEGWPNPDGTKEFRPLQSVTRCDMAAFLQRLANLKK